MHLARHILALDDDPRDDSACLPLAECAPKRGETIAAFLERSGWSVDTLPTVVRVNDLYYSREEWRVRKLRANDNLLVISRPAGGGGGAGGGKGIGAAVALIALSVLAPIAAPALLGGAGGALAGALGATGFKIATSLLAAGIVAGGGLLLSHFLRPKAAKSAPETPLYNFGLSGNAAKPLQMIPVGYGRRLITPDLAAPAYSEYSGSDMTTYGLYVIGCGKYDIEEIRLGATTIWTAEDGPQGVGSAMSFEVVNPGDTVTLFPANVITSTDVNGVQLTHAYSNNGWVGPYVVNPANTTVKELIIDFIWPQGAYVTYKDRIYPLAVGLRVEGRTVNAAGSPTSSFALLEEFSVTLGTKSPYRLTKRISVTPGSRWEIRIGRTGEPFSSTNTNVKLNGTDDVAVSALRAHIEGPNSYSGVTTLAIKATASASLQSINSGKIGVIATRIIPVWNGSAWVEQASRSIAWAAVDAWTNAQYSAGLPLARVDLGTFVAYDDFWSGEGHTFDHWFTEPQSVLDAIETILKAGRAVPDIVGDTLSLSRDEDRGLPAMLFTDREIVRGSLAVNYSLYSANLADGVVGQYLDETTWRLAEVSSAIEGVTLAKPAKVELVGVTKREQAAGLVRFQAAESAYRRTAITWQVEAEGRLIKRGSLVALQTEEPQTWGASGEVSYAYDAPTNQHRLTLNPTPEWDAGASSHWLEIRGRDGAYFGPFRVTKGASDAIAVANNSDISSVQTATGRTIAQTVYRATGEEAPSYVFGPGQARAYRCIVKEGSPSGDLFTLVAVNDDSRVYDVVETGVPALPTVPPYLNPDAAPSIVQLSGVMRQDGLNAVLHASWLPAGNAVRYIAQVSYDSGVSWGLIYDGDQPRVSAIVSPTTLQLRVAAYSDRNVQGAWTTTTVNGIDIYVSNEITNLVVDLDSFRPDALDRTVLEPVFRDHDLELSSFTLQANAAQKTIDTTKEIRATASGLIAEAMLADGLNIAIDQVTASVEAQYNDLSAQVAAESTARVGADAALSTRIDTLEATSGGADAQVLAEAVARANADNAIAGQQTTIVATAILDDDGTELGAFTRAIGMTEDQRRALRQSSASIQQVAVTQATQEQSLAIVSEAVTANYRDLSAQVTAEAQARSTSDDALAFRATTLESTVNNATTGLVATRARLITEETTRASADTALSTRTTALESTLNTPTTGVVARLTTEETTRATADTALATRASALESTVNNATTGLVATRARLLTEETTRADADTALATRASALEATVNNETTGLVATRASLATEETTRANADTALATRASALESTVNNATTGLVATRSRLLTEETTRANADTALSSRATALESTVNNATTGVAATAARVDTQELATADIEDAVYGQWAVQISTQTQSGGGTFRKVSGFGLIQAGGGGAVQSEFNISVDRFNILPAVATNVATSKKPVFTVGTIGDVADIGISGNMFLDGTITANKLEINQLSAINQNMGVIVSGKIQSADTKFVIDATNKRIVISD